MSVTAYVEEVETKRYNMISAEKLIETMDRYGFKDPPPVLDNRKFRVSFRGQEAIMTYSELCEFQREIGPEFYPIATEIKE